MLVALTIQEIPIDVLAERLGSTRGALYKTLHDARRTLRAQLAAAGHDLESPRHERSTHRSAPSAGSWARPIPRPPATSASTGSTPTSSASCARGDAERAMPELAAHLRGCSACAEDHDSLRALALEDRGSR